MNLKCVYLLICIFIIANTHTVYANNAISIGAGNGTRGIHGYRVNLQRAWANDKITYNNRKLSGYWELAFTKITSSRVYCAPTNSTDSAFAASIMLRIPFHCILNWFCDIGIGLAYMQHQEVAMRDMGSNLLFEDKLGFGILLGKAKQFEAGYRLVHYSNAYLAQKNQAVNLHLIMLGYWFN